MTLCATSAPVCTELWSVLEDCPKCGQEGESMPYETDLICPFCLHEWTRSPYTVGCHD